MSHQTLWREVRAALSPFGAVVRVENPVGPGTPDVAYALRRPTAQRGQQASCGWIELKWMPRLPREGRAVVVRDLTLDQVEWPARWIAAGGRCWLLLAAPGLRLLLDHRLTRSLFERGLTFAAAVEGAAAAKRGAFSPGELLWHLTS